MVVSPSEVATKDFHRPSCLAAIFTASRTQLVSTQAVFQKRINARRQSQESRALSEPGSVSDLM